MTLIYYCLTDPTDGIWRHVAADIQNFPFPTAKQNLVTWVKIIHNHIVFCMRVLVEIVVNTK